MERRRIVAALVIVVLILSSVATIRIVDPFQPQSTGPELDFSDSPEEIAQDALLQTKYRDFTVDIYVTDADLPVNDQLAYNLVSHEKYENTDQEHGSWDSSESRMETFRNPYFTWERGTWEVYRRNSQPHYTLPRSYNEASLPGCDCISIEAENSSTLVLRTHRLDIVAPLSPAINSSEHQSRVTLVIDKDEPALKTIRYRYYFENASNDDELAVYAGKESYSNWGTTEVQRPSWATYTIEEAIKDIQNVERDAWLGK